MSSNSAIRLLIFNDSLSEAERLISMLNNAGRSNRAQHVESEDALTKLLQEQTWDLAIGMATTANVPAPLAVKHIRRLSKDIPLILLSEEEGSKAVVEGMKLGAVDVVILDEDQHLLQVISRELKNRENRAQQRLAERRYKEIERRNQQLLDSSKYAIAFLQDGMFLYVNESFAELLGHEDRDDLECMPVVDVIDAEDQDRVKAFLKDFMLQSADDDSDKLEFKTESGVSCLFDVRKAQYDDEVCIQFMSKTRNGGSTNSAELEAKLQQIKHQDLVTGLHNKTYLMNKLESAVDQAIAHDTAGALLYIEIHDFLETVQTKLGVASSDIVLGTIAAHAKSLIKNKEILCRFSENGFMLLIPDILADEAQARAEEIGEQLRSHIIDIDGATLNFVFHVGVGLFNETTSSSDLPITHARKALDMVLKKHQENKSIIALTYEDESSKSESDSLTSKEMAKLVQKALVDGKFKLLFQPILSLRGSDKEHYEVLLRMVDESTHGMSPNDFMEVASQIGAMPKIDRWVILETIKLLSERRNEGSDTRLIINLSKDSLKDTTLPPWLGVAFKAAKLPPDAIIFQMREMDVNDHINLVKTFTEQVSSLGCGCCIMQFGCALNPFNVLQHVDAKYVKVDGSFTKELQEGTGEPEALSQLVKELHQQDKITIVPFVENASVLSKLWQSGVHYIQGYYLQGPTEQMDYDFDTET